MVPKTFYSSSDQETQDIARELVSSLKSGTVICLIGPMASGKTTFSQGVGKALNIPRIVSPTYLIMREYPIASQSFLKRLYHLDLYRLKTAEEIKSFDIDEIWHSSDNLVLIEWPESMLEMLPKIRVDVVIKPTGENERQITIIKHQ